MLKSLYELLHEYTKELTAIEKEIVRKYKVNEDFKADLEKAKELKILQEVTINEMRKYVKTK